MFGTLSPPRCGNSLPVVQTHRRFYCGTCKSLGTHFGQARRALLSHDAVFMAVLADALQQTPAPPGRCRCPMMPVAFRPTVAPDSTAMRYAASMQIVLADQWLADRAADGGRLAQAVRPLVSRRAAQTATATLVELGADLTAVDGFELRQKAVETMGRPSPTIAASPTAAALAAVFEAIVSLPGTAKEARSEAVRAGLARLGAAVGTAIYLVDALEDLHDDARSGDFNACTDTDGDPCRARVNAACGELTVTLETIATTLAALPLLRHRDLLHGILVRQLGQRSRRAIATANAQLQAAEGEALARWRNLPRSRRAMVRAMTAIAMLWSWATSLIAEAAPAGGEQTGSGSSSTSDSSGGTDASGTDSDGLDDSPQPDLGTPDASTGPDTGGPEGDLGVGGCGDPCDGCSTGCQGCFGGCGSCFGSCGSCGESCQSGLSECIGGCSTCGSGCGNGCSDCGNDCGRCGSDCGSCGNGCSSCGSDCGSCGNGCSSCGSDCGNCGSGCSTCGSDCGNCGSGCSGCGNGCGGGGGACCH